MERRILTRMRGQGGLASMDNLVIPAVPSYTPQLSIHFTHNVFAITLQRRGHGLSNSEEMRSRAALNTLALVIRCVCSISGHQPT